MTDRKFVGRSVPDERQFWVTSINVQSWRRVIIDCFFIFTLHCTCFSGEPDPPSHLTVVSSNASTITFNWQPPFDGNSPITYYEVEVADEVTSKVKTVNATLPPAHISSLVLNRDYTVRVRARNADVGSGRFSTQLTVGTANTAGR